MSIALILVFLLTFLFWFVMIKKNKKFLYDEGFLFLEIDLKEWRIRKNSLIWNKELNKNQLNKKINNIIGFGWINISTFLKTMNENQMHKWNSAIEFCVQNKTNIQISIYFELGKKQEEKSYWNVEFVYIENKQLRANVKWINKVNIKLNCDVINNRQELLEDSKKYKLFATFGLRNKDNEYVKNFIYKISFLLEKFKIKNVNYFMIAKNIIVFVFKSDKFSKLTKIKNKFIKKINNFSIDNFYNSSTYVEAKNIKTKEDLAKIITRISFGLTKSKLTNNLFHFNLQNIFFDEFEEYKKTINELNKILNTNSFKINKIKISSSLNTKKMDYYMPQYEIKFNNWVPFVIDFLNFNEKLNTLVFKKITKENHCKSTCLLDISNFDIEQNFEKLKSYNKIVYVIDIDYFKKPLEIIKLLKLLKKHNIKTGLKTNKFNSSVLSIIENGKPNALILSKEFNKNFYDNSTYGDINKIILVLMCERLSVLPIFENIEERVKLSINNAGKKNNYYYNLNKLEL